MSNYERQQLFRERHPGYYRRYSAKARAQARLTQALALAEAPAQVARPEPLMLPAPVETIEIDMAMPAELILRVHRSS